MKIGDQVTVTGCDWHDVHGRTAVVERIWRDSVWVRWSCGAVEMFRRDTGASVALWRSASTTTRGGEHAPARRLAGDWWQAPLEGSLADAA